MINTMYLLVKKSKWVSIWLFMNTKQSIPITLKGDANITHIYRCKVINQYNLNPSNHSISMYSCPKFCHSPLHFLSYFYWPAIERFKMTQKCYSLTLHLLPNIFYFNHCQKSLNFKKKIITCDKIFWGNYTEANPELEYEYLYNVT